MDSASESDDSDGMRDLVRRGFAIRRDGEHTGPEWGYQGEIRAQVRDLDVSHVQRLLTLTVSAGAASTHGLTPATQSLVTAAGRNIYKYRPININIYIFGLYHYTIIHVLQCST